MLYILLSLTKEHTHSIASQINCVNDITLEFAALEWLPTD